MTATPGLLSHAGLCQMEETPYPYENELSLHPFSFCMGNTGGGIMTPGHGEYVA